MKRTAEERQAAVKALQQNKEVAPRKNIFGEDNHARIDAMIDVINDSVEEDDIYSRWPDDEEDGDAENYLRSGALDALAWMNGEEDLENLLF